MVEVCGVDMVECGVPQLGSEVMLRGGVSVPDTIGLKLPSELPPPPCLPPPPPPLSSKHPDSTSRAVMVRGEGVSGGGGGTP